MSVANDNLVVDLEPIDFPNGLLCKLLQIERRQLTDDEQLICFGTKTQSMRPTLQVRMALNEFVAVSDDSQCPLHIGIDPSCGF